MGGEMYNGCPRQWQHRLGRNRHPEAIWCYSYRLKPVEAKIHAWAFSSFQPGGGAVVLHLHFPLAAALASPPLHETELARVLLQRSASAVFLGFDDHALALHR